jgi:hypothetical protein
VADPEAAEHDTAIYQTSFVSAHYVAKAERKGRSKAEVDEIIRRLTGLREQALDAGWRSGSALTFR